MPLIGQGSAILSVLGMKSFYSKLQILGFSGLNMTLEFEESAIKVLEEHIEILKQNLLFLMAEHKPENIPQIITVKREN
jgi:hypothetical protein